MAADRLDRLAVVEEMANCLVDDVDNGADGLDWEEKMQRLVEHIDEAMI
jgi:hypothetical protein